MRILGILLILILSAPGICLPEGGEYKGAVAMVTEIHGVARRADKPIVELTPLMENDRLTLESGTTATIVSLGELLAYEIEGRTDVVITHGRPVMSGGAPKSQYSIFPSAGKGIRPGVIEQASTRTRGTHESGDLQIIGPTATMITDHPVFRWSRMNLPGMVTIKLYNEGGDLLYDVAAQGEQVSLPPSIVLKEGASYTWTVEGKDSEGRPLTDTGNFIVAEREQVQWKAGLGECERTITTLVACALLLEQEGFRDDATQYWQTLADIAPNNELVLAHQSRPF